MRLWSGLLILAFVAVLLVGCGGDTPATAESQDDVVQLDSSEAQEYTSEVLGTDYEGSLSVGMQLALGTFTLEDAELAVTPEQAKALLPLWQAIQSGSLQSEAETNAVLKQIEKAMSAEQLEAIATLQLTREKMGTWMQEQGMALGPPPGAEEGQGGLGPMGNLSEEDRANRRATAQAGGMGEGFGQGGFGDMSEEDRANMRATAEASGMDFGDRQPGARGGAGQLVFLAEPLVELLTERVAE